MLCVQARALGHHAAQLTLQGLIDRSVLTPDALESLRVRGVLGLQCA